MNSIQPKPEFGHSDFRPNFKPVMTQREVADALGISKTRVQSAERSALRKIRLHLERAGYGVEQ